MRAAPDLFAAAAERMAFASGRALSQTRTELLAPAGWSCLCGTPLGRNLLATCKGCGK